MTHITKAQRTFATVAALAGLLLVVDAARALPPLVGYVNDNANLLSPTEAQALETRLRDYADTTGHQFVVVSVPTTGELDIDQYAVELEQAWQVGDHERNDGLLLVIASNDNRVRIEVGYGLEGAVSNVLASQVISDVLKPTFQTRQFASGINAALDILCRAAEHAAIRTPRAGGWHLATWQRITLLLLAFFAASFLLSYFTHLLTTRVRYGTWDWAWRSGDGVSESDVEYRARMSYSSSDDSRARRDDSDSSSISGNGGSSGGGGASDSW